MPQRQHRNKKLKTSDLVARRIVRDIKARRLQAGEMLPSEGRMLDHYGVGRSSLREALRLLEAQGVVRVRPGAHGGPMVDHGDPSFLGSMLALSLNMSDTSYGELSDFLKILYALAARLAAERATPEEAAELCRLASEPDACAVHGSSETGLEHNEPLSVSRFHIALEYAAGNRVLDLIMDIVRAIFVDHLIESTDTRIFECDPADHAAIAERVAAGDGNAASDLMYRHISHVVERHRARIPGIFEVPVRW